MKNPNPPGEKINPRKQEIIELRDELEAAKTIADLKAWLKKIHKFE